MQQQKLIRMAGWGREPVNTVLAFPLMTLINMKAFDQW